MSVLVVICGLSGAGRSTAAAALEDAGWFVVDNLPLALIPKVVELGAEGRSKKLALVIGPLAPSDVVELAELVGELRASPGGMQLIFLDATDDALVSRFEGTKRRHPVAAVGLVESITAERAMLAPIRELADVIIETSELSVHELRERTLGVMDPEALTNRLQVRVSSFGYKYGLPRDADLVIDTRFLPNPYWHRQYRDLTGLDADVRRFILDRPETRLFLDRLWGLVEFLLPQFVAEGKSYLNVAIGCTGGRHRSVVVAEVLAHRIKQAGFPVGTRHRDMERQA
jgi:UPF0042 nucleotide-binding protein